MTVQPRSRFKMKIARKLRLWRPMIDRRKYNERQSPGVIRWNTDAEILSQKLTKIGSPSFRKQAIQRKRKNGHLSGSATELFRTPTASRNSAPVRTGSVSSWL